MRLILNRFNAKPTLADAARLTAYADKHPRAVAALRDSDQLSLTAARSIR